MARTAKDKASSHRLREPSGLIADLLLIFSREVNEVIVFRADQERDGRLVEASSLSIPFFDTVECGFAGQVEHEEDGDGVVADEWKHVDEFALTAEIPY